MNLLNKIWPFSIINKKQAEIERLHEVILKQIREDITLEDLSGDKNGLSMTLSGSPMHLFADAFGSQFFESGATNFLTMSFTHVKSNEMFEVTMQKVSGEALCDQLRRLKGEIESLNKVS